MRPTALFSTLLLLAASTPSWATILQPTPTITEAAVLLPRQNGNNNNNNNQNQASSSSAPPRNGNGNGNNNNNDKNKQTSKYKTTKTFDERLPPGGVSMITPAAILGPQYYKIGNPSVKEFITFAWNFTSLSITPSAVDVLASCAINSATYTIALNETIKGHTQQVVWDTGEYERTASQPLPIATYTLIIYDSESSPDAVARAGYLDTYNQYTFGMYSPKPAVPLSEFVCATCNGAGALERRTLGLLLGMVGITVLSFGWFTGVAGLW